MQLCIAGFTGRVRQDYSRGGQTDQGWLPPAEWIHTIWQVGLIWAAGVAWCLRSGSELTCNKISLFHMKLCICASISWWCCESQHDFDNKYIDSFIRGKFWFLFIHFTHTVIKSVDKTLNLTWSHFRLVLYYNHV